MLFEFNFYSALLLPGFIQGVIFSILLLIRAQREERNSDRWLAFLLALCCLYIANWMLGFAGWYDARNSYTTFMFYFPWNNSYLFGPVIYLFFRSLTNSSFRLSRTHWWFFLPGFLILLAKMLGFTHDVLWQHWWKGDPLPFFYGTKGPYGQLSVPVIDWPALALLWTYAFLFLTIRAYRRYRHYLRDNFSDAETLDFKWLRNLLIGVTAGITLVWVITLVDRYLMELDYRQNWIAYFGMSILVYYLAIAGYAAPKSSSPRLRFSPEDLPQPATAPFQELESQKEKLEQYVRDEKPFLKPDLSLQELATALGTNTSVLSRLINQGFDQNFNDFINAYRVEVFKEKLLEPGKQHLTLLAIALDCGFNSKATFNRAFRKVTGQSPSEYLRQVKSRKEKASD